MSKRNIILIAVLAVVIIGAVVISVSGANLKGLLTQRLPIPSCLKAGISMPKVTYVYAYHDSGDDVFKNNYLIQKNGYRLNWIVENLCGGAKFKLYAYRGESLPFTAEPKPINLQVSPPNFTSYSLPSEVAGDLSKTSACAPGKCFSLTNFVPEKVNNLSLYTLEPSVAAKVPVNIQSPLLSFVGKAYYLLQITDQNGKELAKSPILVVKAVKTANILDFKPVAVTSSGENAYKLKWVTENLSSDYELKLYAYTGEVFVLTAEAKAGMTSVSGSENLAYSSFYLPIWDFIDKFSNVKVFSSESPILTVPAGKLKSYWVLVLKFKDVSVKNSPILSVWKEVLPMASEPVLPSKK